MGGQRAFLNTPHPIYGIDAGGFSVGDLPPSYTSPTAFLTNVTGNTTSNPIQLNANMGVQLSLTFSDNATSCDITVLRVDPNPGGEGTVDTPLVTFKGCNNLTGDVYVGFYDQRVTIDGKPLKVQTANWAGTGNLSVSGCRTN